ncbi:unnamed protein product [Acanthoscelides obtectus]|uniref:Uncharacterized protein n=1 Tax=Acanthoscelides obtectus TaxID=200917 RepID=A0A9P0Q5N6_ACAOB|nr:unnamed protein product [Acanthoscelides obtectus]CAK1633577.1 hypothetical protein AOBTE_LOCUS8233 [Acanthoscelides obtectus]
MYASYVEECANENIVPVSTFTYRQIFVNDFNFGFGSPKTDTCAVCDVGSNEEHVAKYKKAFDVQKSNRENAKANEKIIYLTFDLQKTLPLPKISTSKAFYVRQVWLYNLGIYLISTQQQNGKGFFHVWTEDQGSRGPEEIGSSLMAFLENIKDQAIAPDHLIAWSDSAGGQNKKIILSVYGTI